MIIKLLEVIKTKGSWEELHNNFMLLNEWAVVQQDDI